MASPCRALGTAYYRPIRKRYVQRLHKGIADTAAARTGDDRVLTWIDAAALC